MEIWKKSQHPGENYCPSTGIEASVAIDIPLKFEIYGNKLIMAMSSSILGEKTEVEGFCHKMNKRKFKIVEKPEFLFKVDLGENLEIRKFKYRIPIEKESETITAELIKNNYFVVSSFIYHLKTETFLIDPLNEKNKKESKLKNLEREIYENSMILIPPKIGNVDETLFETHIKRKRKDKYNRWLILLLKGINSLFSDRILRLCGPYIKPSLYKDLYKGVNRIYCSTKNIDENIDIFSILSGWSNTKFRIFESLFEKGLFSDPKKLWKEAYDPLSISKNAFYRNLWEIFDDLEYIQRSYSNSNAINIAALLVGEILRSRKYNFLPKNLKLTENFFNK